MWRLDSIREEDRAIFTVRWIIIIQLVRVCFAVLLHALHYVVIIMQIALVGIEDFRVFISFGDKW